MKASDTKGGDRVKWTKEGKTRTGTVRAFDEFEHVIGIDDGRHMQIVSREQEVTVIK